jgi:hypothetical protein
MTSVQRAGRMAALGLTLLTGGGLTVTSAQAAFVMTLTEQGGNVVVNGSGTIDLADLSFSTSLLIINGEIVPAGGLIVTVPAPFTFADSYTGFSGPASFGDEVKTSENSGSGDAVGMSAEAPLLLVPQGYVSGNSLSDSATYDNQTFASLGATPGTYVWHWGSRPNADSFTLDIIAPAVPEPSAAPLLALALGVAGLLAARRQASAEGLFRCGVSEVQRRPSDRRSLAVYALSPSLRQ